MKKLLTTTALVVALLAPTMAYADGPTPEAKAALAASVEFYTTSCIGKVNAAIAAVAIRYASETGVKYRAALANIKGDDHATMCNDASMILNLLGNKGD